MTKNNILSRQEALNLQSAVDVETQRRQGLSRLPVTVIYLASDSYMYECPNCHSHRIFIARNAIRLLNIQLANYVVNL